jgi:hypothetical protein
MISNCLNIRACVSIAIRSEEIGASFDKRRCDSALRHGQAAAQPDSTAMNIRAQERDSGNLRQTRTL